MCLYDTNATDEGEVLCPHCASLFKTAPGEDTDLDAIANDYTSVTALLNDMDRQREKPAFRCPECGAAMRKYGRGATARKHGVRYICPVADASMGLDSQHNGCKLYYPEELLAADRHCALEELEVMSQEMVAQASAHDVPAIREWAAALAQDRAEREILPFVRFYAARIDEARRECGVTRKRAMTAVTRDDVLHEWRRLLNAELVRRHHTTKQPFPRRVLDSMVREFGEKDFCLLMRGYTDWATISYVLPSRRRAEQERYQAAREFARAERGA